MTTRSTIGMATCVLAGAVLGAAAWYVRTDAHHAGPHGVVGAATSEHTQATETRSPLAPSPTVIGSPAAPGVSMRAPPVRLDEPRDERDEPRDPSWAPQVEQLLGELGEKRVRELVPEATWVGVTCRSRGCTMDIDCPGDSGEICQMLANILVVVDGMKLHIRQEPTDGEGRFHVLVDIELPAGDATALRRSMEREQETHPEYPKRIAEGIAMSRRDRDVVP